MRQRKNTERVTGRIKDRKGNTQIRTRQKD